MSALTLSLQIAVLVLSVLIVPLVLAHKSTGGLSGMLGGATASNLNSSGVAHKNLHRMTVGSMILWAALIAVLALVNR